MTIRLKLASALLALSASCAMASDYPSRPITVIVPYGAGGPTDTVARIISQALSEQLGERLVIENVAAAGGTVGSARVARSDKDGYTLLFNHIGMATAPFFYPNAPAHPVKDFDPIGQVADVPMSLIGRQGLGADDGAKLIALAKQKGKEISIAHAGPGTASFLCSSLLQHATGMRPTEVSYNRGFAPAQVDLIAGRVDLICDQTTTTTNAINSGGAKAYAVTTKKRLETLPNVPTMNEIGVKDFELAIWHGFYAPKGTPKPIIDKLSAALEKALRSKLVADRFAELGAVPVSAEDATPAGLAKKLQSEMDRWGPVIQASQKPQSN
ncbi:tripartite tricarboxylate transporter family receptor [Variibacter gotjawalensis]|uniref:Tripartite tricarboxylate transporter family receptor n=1 Tax=Variibacter gotjawalensis TaxID=1333996 RepID=A0A0S3PUF0_9BRAD|nr:tripartite tricarboxylate transporter substrate-binding protein [Variibacter gotjawalensis]NIK49916.1 tripartite-type tricarboxylate transporter receptor subunit TctC [Variibacter gotjawalensis]RZS45915.1 tripartite-type tricarboxylate transporter receptor subunit TctC [Variibacter gotjawalensis]BAT59590.1 tripartite tricarboxylate transporter family receptor [Variibacter gotjawalensis]